MHAIVVSEFGGPEVMTWTELPKPVAGPGEVLVRLTAAGVNFMDVGVRTQPVPGWEIPTVMGVEGAGRVVELGKGVDGLAIGDRVAWYYHKGSFAEYLTIPASKLVVLPDFVDDETAAAIMMQGLTANHFTTETHAIAPGDMAVVHAAAGGVGLLLTQLIKARGGTVIGLVSREDKVAVAKEAGADHVLVSSGGGFEGTIRELTGGEGADVVYDGAGASTFFSSMRALRYHGTMAFYGPFMGLPAMTPQDLPHSIKLSYPTVADHVRTRSALTARTTELFELLKTGELRMRIGDRYPLSDAAKAYADIESRRTTGKLLLIP
jgi:NADPH2:quinone reductase